MLVELVVDNLVIVERGRLASGPGLCVVSGETGAGKSLLLDALQLLLGSRARSGLVGPWGDATVVSACFQVDRALLDAIGDEVGIQVQDEDLLLRRRVSAQGRSQAWVNDQPVSVRGLRSIGARLVELRAQHEQLRLAEPAHQMALLDRFGCHVDQADAYRAAYARCVELQGALDELEGGSAESLRERDFLRFQLDELEQAGVEAGEVAALEERHRLLAEAEEWRSAALTASDAISDGEHGVIARLEQCIRRIEGAPDAELSEAVDRCRDAVEALNDAAALASSAGDRITVDPQALSEADERLQVITDLLRKYGGDEATLLATWAEIVERHGALADLEGRQTELAEALVQARAERDRLGASLAQARRQAFKQMSAVAHAELAELGMPKARLGLVEAEGPAGPNGLGRQQLTVRTNPGLPAGPLDEVPSGGEGARLTLALAVALAEADGTPVVVFDEVDAGVGGRLGGIIGAKLRRLAADGRSVIAISHTPQLAAEADTHYLVSKRQEDDATSVLVEQLQGERRVCEIADMLGGGPAALNQARALLGDAAHEQ